MHPHNILKTSQMHPHNIPKTSQMHPQNIPKTSSKHVPNLQKSLLYHFWIDDFDLQNHRFRALRGRFGHLGIRVNALLVTAMHIPRSAKMSSGFFHLPESHIRVIRMIRMMIAKCSAGFRRMVRYALRMRKKHLRTAPKNTSHLRCATPWL